MKDNDNSMDSIKLTSINDLKEKQKAGDLPKIKDPQHPVYWDETRWQEEFFNTNPDMLWKLEAFKDVVIKKYEESLNGGWQEVN